METRKSSFVDHLNIVESGHNKTASTKTTEKTETSILDKLAAELGLGGAPTAEGQKEVSTKDVTGVAAAVDSATKGVTDSQVAVAGGDVARMEAGMTPHLKGDINTPVAISTGAGDVKTSEGLNRTDEAVAAAARGAGGKEGGKTETAAVSAEKTASEEEAVKVGELIARSFQQTLEKDAADAEYSQSINILDQAGLLEGYNITDKSITKTASVEVVDVLEKIANKQALTRDDIVLGANQYLEVEKLAAQADAEGRELAHMAVAEAMEQEKVAAEKTATEKTEQEKVAELAKDPKVAEAVKVLKASGVL